MRLRVRTMRAPRAITAGDRRALLALWGNCCAYCGRFDGRFEPDHIVPFSRGGYTVLSNIALSCRGCNRAKGEKTAAECGRDDVAERALNIAFAIWAGWQDGDLSGITSRHGKEAVHWVKRSLLCARTGEAAKCPVVAP